MKIWKNWGENAKNYDNLYRIWEKATKKLFQIAQNWPKVCEEKVEYL